VGGTYQPGVVMENGIAMTTADTIGFNTGPTTYSQPFGAGGPYDMGGGEFPGQVYYQSEDQFISAKKGQASALKQRQAQTTMLLSKSAEAEIREMTAALKQSARGDAKTSLATRKSKLAQITKKAAQAQAQAQYQALLKDLDLSNELAGASNGGKEESVNHAEQVIQAQDAARAQKQSLNALGSMESKAALAGAAAQIAQPAQALGSVGPFEYALDADTSMPVQTKTDNIVGTGVVNSALSNAQANSFSMRSDVIMQSPAVVAPQPAAPSMMAPPLYQQHVAVSHIVHGEATWQYTGDNGADKWGDSPAWRVCKTGKNQSPINLELNLKRDDNLKPLRWIGSTNPFEATLVPPLYNNVLTVEGLHGKMTVSGEDMHLKSAVIHTPSEHRFQGRQMHGEIQFEHTAEVDGEDVTMIVSAFLTVSDHTAPSLRTLFDAVAGYEGVYKADNTGHLGYYPPMYGQSVKPWFWTNVAKLAEDVLGTGSNYANYLTYYGSLTRPPCTEGVTWVLLKTPLPIAASDHAILLEEQGAMNFRPTQELYDREVYDTATGRSGGFQSPGFF